VIIRNHVWKMAEAKGISPKAIQEVANRKSSLFYVRTHGLGKCSCGVAKEGWNGIGTIDGVRYAIEMVACPKCGDFRTAYKMNNDGCTPIRPDQWARGERKYERKCGDCGRTIRITAQTWEKLREQTTHPCKNGKVADLIAEEHKDMKGKYHPKG
jgi:hypothetical protein